MEEMAAPLNVEKTKKLLNSPRTCVSESLEGFLLWNPGLVSLPGCSRVVVRRDWLARAGEGKVAIVTGGGSGHEPCFAGFVGRGMATAAVHGDLFAAPSPRSILSTLTALGKAGNGGIFLVFNNYTGDRLNFGIAAERAKSLGIKVEVVVNEDDCALGGGAKFNCRRGLSGLVLLLKILGQMSDSGSKLEDIAEFARRLLPNIATMAVAWSSCSLPGGNPLFELGPDEMELGLGMHGEAGMKRIKMTSAKKAASLLLTHMTNTELPVPFIKLTKDVSGSVRFVILLNNMGSTSDIEMNVFAREVYHVMSSMEGIAVDRMYVGRYVTSQEMAGISITIMTTDDFINDCLDSQTAAVSWVAPVVECGFEAPQKRQKKDDDVQSYKNVCKTEDDDDDYDDDDDSNKGSEEEKGPRLTEVQHAVLIRTLTSLSNLMVANRDLLNTWDSASGDGDCGNTFASGAIGIIDMLQKGKIKDERSCSKIADILSRVVEDTMGGTTGGLYSLFLTAASQTMKEMNSFEPLTNDKCIRAMRRGIAAISKYGGATAGDRTMIDPLNAACSHLEKGVGSVDTLSLWQQALKVADQEMRRTKDMEARSGRASYVNRDLLVHPDPGAKACTLCLTAVVNSLIDFRKQL